MLVDRAANVTHLCGREPPTDVVYNRPCLRHHVVQDADEATESQVRHLATPHPLHAAKIQVFQVYGVIGLAQLIGQVPVIRVALVGYLSVYPCKVLVRLAPITGSLLPARKLAIGIGYSVSSLLEEFWRFVPAAVVACEVRLEAEIEPDAFTCQGSIRFLILAEARKEQVQITKCVSFDSYSLDIAIYLARVRELIGALADTNTVAAKQLPPRLFEREGFSLADLAESRRAYPFGRLACFAILDVRKESLVGAVDSLDDILDSLGTEHVPKYVLRQALQLCNVGLKTVCRKMFAEHAVIAAMQSDAMIVDDSADINLLMQAAVLFAAVHLKSKRLARHLNAPLVLNILFNNVQRYCSDRRDELASSPKTRETLLEPGILRSQNMRGVSFYLADDGDNSNLRVRIHQQVHMIGHDFHTQNLIPVLGLFFIYELFEARYKRLIQDIAPILRAPYDVVLAAVDDGMRRVIWFGRLFDFHLLTPLDRHA